MNSQSQPTPAQPPVQQPIAAPQLTPEQIEQIHASNKKKLTWGLICLIAPTALIIISIFCYAVINFVTTSTSTSSDALYATPSAAHTIGNIIMFLIGVVSILTWLPGIIIGIVLLSQRQRV